MPSRKGDRHQFRFAVVTAEGSLEGDIESAEQVITPLASGDWRLDLCISPPANPTPSAVLSADGDHGIVFLCFEDDSSRGCFLVRTPHMSEPRVEIEHGGQAMERWPPELFVPPALAITALDHFLETGRPHPDLHWVDIGAFRRITVWEGATQRRAWEDRRRSVAKQESK